jgi:hypothetical protein
VLDRAFRDTYGLGLNDVFGDLDRALGTYRHAVGSVIPEMTRVAWHLKKKELEANGYTHRRFVYRLSRAGYRKEWHGPYEEPGTGARVIAFFLRIVPKIGPFKALAFKAPPPQAEQYFEASFDKTLDCYAELLARQRHHRLQLEDLDFDTGDPTRPGEYGMADAAYSKLAQKLADKDPSTYPEDIRQSVLAFYSDLGQPYSTRQEPEEWQKTLAAVNKLRSVGTATRVQQ